MTDESVCQCSTWRNAAYPPDRRSCSCTRKIGKKYVLCRPCAVNWHDGPCDQFTRDPAWISGWPWQKHCLRCGHDSASHRFEERPNSVTEDPYPDRVREIAVSDWQYMTEKEFRDTGLLWAVNHFVLWALGDAIGVDVENENPQDSHVRLLRLPQPETIVGGDLDLAKEPEGKHPMERFVAYAKARIDSMPDEAERQLARSRLAPIIPDILG